MRRMIAINTKGFLKMLENAGWKTVRTKGSHFILKHALNPLVLSVPYREGDISLPLVKRLMKEAGILVSKKIENAV